MKRFTGTFKAGIFKDRRGATAIEYGLIAGLIAMAVVGAIGTLGASTGGMWDTIDQAWRNA